jgi:dTDP-D-glucose 4,6-dehydratase
MGSTHVNVLIATHDMTARKAHLFGETYNIGGGNEWANIDIVRLICAQFDEVRFWSLLGHSGEVRRLIEN